MAKTYAVRDNAVADLIGARRDFKTWGNFYGEPVRFASPWNYGWLRADGKTAWQRDAATVDYVVWSYSTPVAWHTAENGWVVVDKAFSSTSGKHQSAAKWGVSKSEDERVTYVMINYRLTDAQRTLLYAAYTVQDTVTPLKGGEKVSARKLQEKGLLVVASGNCFAVITNKGKAVFA